MTLRLRVLLAAVIALLITVGVSVGALAFTAQSGFSATTYATLPSGNAAGVTFIGTTMYLVDPSSGNLYAVPIGGPLSRVATISGGPTGLASYGGSLYATRVTTNDVVRIDPLTGATTLIAPSSAFSGTQVNAIAADTLTGDLYVTATFGYVWVIHTPETPTTPAPFVVLPGDAPGYGITVAADRSLFVVVPSTSTNGVWHYVAGDTPKLIATFSGGRGLGVIPGYVYVNDADGTIQKLIIPGEGTGANLTALTGGSVGDLATIGTDGCFYASQGAAVIRVASQNGSCDLANTTPPPPPPTLTLTNVSAGAAVIGGIQTFDATLGNVTNPAGITVTYTVTRGNSTTTGTATTGQNGVASFGYAAATAGIDVVTANAVVNSTTLASNPVTVTWIAIDRAAPTISFSITSGTPGATFACPDPSLSTPGSVYCGWFTTPPTIHFRPTANGTTPVSANCPDFTLSVDSAGTPVTCVATNGDGVQTILTVYLRLLATPPTITPSGATPSGPYLGGPTKENVTVTFACASDPALDDPATPGNDAISFCTAPVTVTTEGYTTVNGYVIDVAGTRVDASSGSILIDKTGPVIAATMQTATDGLPYAPGTPTTQDVLVSFACSDALDPHPVCPSPVRVSTGTSATATASDWAGNTTTSTFGGIVIDRTGPVVSTAITPAPDANGNDALSATVNVSATDPSGLGSITYSATGAQSIASTTVVIPARPTTFTLPVALDAIGTTIVSYSATDRLGNVSATGTVIVKIIATQPTSIAITSSPVQPQSATVVTARLLGLGGAPAAGKTVTLTAGTTTVSAITDANGIATANLALVPGSYRLSASFAGATGYLPSGPVVQTLTVFAPTQFVIWGGNVGGVVPGQRVVFWGEHWWDAVNLAEKAKVKDFKGYADSVSGVAWTAKGGDSKPPQAIPTYISVIITTSIERIDDKGVKRISGNVVGRAILRVDSPYKDDPGKPVYGVVVAVIP